MSEPKYYEVADAAVESIHSLDRQDNFKLTVNDESLKPINEDDYSVAVNVDGGFDFEFQVEGVDYKGRLDAEFEVVMAGNTYNLGGFTPDNQTEQLLDNARAHRMPYKDEVSTSIDIERKDGTPLDPDYKDEVVGRISEYAFDTLQHTSGVAHRMSYGGIKDSELNRSHDKLRGEITEKIKSLENKKENSSKVKM